MIDPKQEAKVFVNNEMKRKELSRAQVNDEIIIQAHAAGVKPFRGFNQWLSSDQGITLKYHEQVIHALHAL